jgi:hypothetical protein
MLAQVPTIETDDYGRIIGQIQIERQAAKTLGNDGTLYLSNDPSGATKDKARDLIFKVPPFTPIVFRDHP